MAHEKTATPSGDKVKLTLTVSLSRPQAEKLTARAIREGKNLEALVAELLEAESELNATRFVMVAGLLLVPLASLAEAHRSGCHRWHSCPSDTGSYVCGDLGYCSACPNNEYCGAGQVKRQSTDQSAANRRNPTPTFRAGVPPQDAWTCPATNPIKGNFTTYSGERCI